MPILQISCVGETGEFIRVQFGQHDIVEIFFAGDAVVFFGKCFYQSRFSGLCGSVEEVYIFEFHIATSADNRFEQG